MDDDTKTFTEGEIYQKHFQSRKYLDFYYAFAASHVEEVEISHFFLRKLNQTFSSGEIKGQRLIDIGTGPCIYNLISACQHFDEICVSDFTDSNLQEIKMWLNNEDGCFDWNPVIQFVCNLEGNTHPSQVEQHLRQRVKQVLRCDVRLGNPFHPLTVEPADCVTTSLCLEAACKDLETYRRALQSVSALLRPGGVLVMTGVLGETFYLVGKQRFSCLYLTRDDIETILKDLKYSIKEFDLFPSQNEADDTSDFKDMFHLVAIKYKPN